MALRAGSHDDIAAVLAFWREATAEPSTTDDADALAALLARSPDGLILAVSDGAIVGSIIGAWDGWRGALYRLAVSPAYRRQGIATALVAAAEQLLRDAGVRRMGLIAGRAGGAGVEAFWRSAGYEATEQVRFVKTFIS